MTLQVETVKAGPLTLTGAGDNANRGRGALYLMYVIDKAAVIRRWTLVRS